MTRAQERPAQLPALRRIPPVAGQLPFVARRMPSVAGQAPFALIPNPGVPKTRRFCAFWGGNPAAVWTGARSGLGTPVESAGLQTPEDLLFPTLKSGDPIRSGFRTPVECRGFRHSGTAESTGLQTSEDLLFPALKSEISDLPFLPFSSAPPAAIRAPTIQPKTLTPLECAVTQIAPVTLLEYALTKETQGGGRGELGRRLYPVI